MFGYACVMYVRLYGAVVCIKTCEAICLKKDILYTCTTKIHKGEEKMLQAKSQKEASAKLMKGLLDLIILQFLSTQPMHGYQVITKIRKNYGVYFGASTIYPLLGTLEKKHLVDSQWNMDYERPRKVYKLTNDGQSVLSFTEDSLNMICRKLTVAGHNQPTVGFMSENKKANKIPVII